MDVLSYLKSRQNELERVNHPFAQKDENFRYLYSYGIAVLALGNMKAITEIKDAFDYFLECIALPKNLQDKLMLDINHSFEFRLSETLKVLNSKDIQYCFLLDLYQLSSRTIWASEYCEKILDNYITLFHCTQAERDFFYEFNEARLQKNVERAVNAYQTFTELDYYISYTILRYFFSDFYLEETYQNLHVGLGERMILDKPVVVNGNVTVERGGTLEMIDADIRIHGAVYVDGGRISMKNSRIIVEECESHFLLNVRDSAFIQLENTMLDCNFQCGGVSVKSGHVIITETEFCRSKQQTMLEFVDAEVNISHCSFLEGRAGFIRILGTSSASIIHTDFYQAYAENGGAIYSDSISQVKIVQCTFRSCEAKYLGGAIYFKYKKLGQMVSECTFRRCYPEDSVCFNVYEDDFELKIR